MALYYRPMKRSEWRGFLKSLALAAFIVLFGSLAIADAVAFFVSEL